MAKAKAPLPQPVKLQPKPAAPAPKAKAPAHEPKPAPPAPKPPQDPFEALWDRFCTEANFNPDSLEAEASIVREDIAKIEQRLAERREDLDAITRRQKTARDKMAALLKIGFGPEAVLSAMKVEFKARKGGVRKDKEPEATDDEKAAVLDVLDREGQPLSEIAKSTGRDPKELQRVLGALIAAGKVNALGERKARVYMLA